MFIYCYRTLNYNSVLYPLVISDPDEYYDYNPSVDGDYITFLLFDPKLDYNNDIQQFDDKFQKMARHKIQFYTTNFMTGYYSVMYYKKVIMNALSYEYKFTSEYEIIINVIYLIILSIDYFIHHQFLLLMDQCLFQLVAILIQEFY